MHNYNTNKCIFNSSKDELKTLKKIAANDKIVAEDMQNVYSNFVKSRNFGCFR